MVKGNSTCTINMLVATAPHVCNILQHQHWAGHRSKFDAQPIVQARKSVTQLDIQACVVP